MRLNLIHLSSLEAITEHGTLAGAAAALGYTPGALSQQMDALSRAVGAPVFMRSGRRVELTDVGRTLAAHAPRVLAAERALVDDLRTIGTTIKDRFTLGVWGSTSAALVAPVVSTAHELHPGLQVRSLEVDVDEAADAVIRRKVDVAFGLIYPDSPMRYLTGVSVVSLRSERFDVAVPLDHPRAGATVALAELAGQQWVLPAPSTIYGHAMRVACRRAGFEPEVVHEITDTAATLTLASRGVGIAPITDLMHVLSPVGGIGRIALRDAVERELVLIAPHGYRRLHALEALVEVIREATRSATKSLERPPWREE